MNIRQQVDVCIGQTGTPVGSLTYVQQGQRENTSFAYIDNWLSSPDRFQISPDLALTTDYQQRKAATKSDSPFHYAIADTAPDAWGRRVIARAHAKQRRSRPELGRCAYFALTPAQAQDVLAEVVTAVTGWKTLALSVAVGLKVNEVNDFAHAFDPP